MYIVAAADSQFNVHCTFIGFSVLVPERSSLSPITDGAVSLGRSRSSFSALHSAPALRSPSPIINSDHTPSNPCQGSPTLTLILPSTHLQGPAALVVPPLRRRPRRSPPPRSCSSAAVAPSRPGSSAPRCCGPPSGAGRRAPPAARSRARCRRRRPGVQTPADRGSGQELLVATEEENTTGREEETLFATATSQTHREGGRGQEGTSPDRVRHHRQVSCPHVLQPLPPIPLSFSPLISGSTRPAPADLFPPSRLPPTPTPTHLAHDNTLDLGKHAPGLQLKADEGGRVVDVERPVHAKGIGRRREGGSGSAGMAPQQILTARQCSTPRPSCAWDINLLAVHPYARVLLQMHRAHGELREERWTLHVPKLVLRDDAVRRHRPVPWPCLPIAVQLGGGALRGGAARCCTAFLLQVILLQVPVIFGLALGTGARAGVMIGRGPETHS